MHDQPVRLKDMKDTASVRDAWGGMSSVPRVAKNKIKKKTTVKYLIEKLKAQCSQKRFLMASLTEFRWENGLFFHGEAVFGREMEVNPSWG